MNIPSSLPIELSRLAPQTPQTQEATPGSFANLLADAVERVGDLQASSDAELRKLLAGEPVELHRVLLAKEEAALAFNLGLAVRNKVLETYQEIMRIQV